MTIAMIITTPESPLLVLVLVVLVVFNTTGFSEGRATTLVLNSAMGAPKSN